MDSFINQEDIYHLIMNRTPTAMGRDFNVNLKAHNIPITREQLSILAVLWKDEGCSQQHLADRTYRDKPGITRLIDNLEKENLVKRKPDPKDRRSNLIYLTKKGREMESKVTQIIQQSIDKALQGIDKEDALTLKRILDRIYKNLK